MKTSKLTLSILLILTLVLGSLGSVSAASSENLSQHWAADTLTKWMNQGLIRGYEDGSVKPDAPVTRGEFVSLVNRALGLKEASTEVSFTDLKAKHWAYTDIAIAVQAGYLHGNAGKVMPDSKTTRQEAAVMLAGVLKLDTSVSSSVYSFKDDDKIAAWSKSSITALAEKGVLKGDEKGNFRPVSPITRAEAVVAIDAAVAVQQQAAATTTFDKAGVYGPASGSAQVINGNVVIAAEGVTLQNTIVTGNLLIAKSVQEGDVTLKKTTVKGTMTVQGGGPNSIHMEDSVLLRIIVNKDSGEVRIVAIGATTVQDVYIQSPVKIEESGVTDSGFKNIEVSKALPANSNVELVGVFENVSVLATNIKVNIPSGSISNLQVAAGAENNTINVGKEAKVLQLVLDAVSKLVGEGKIENATVNEGAKGSNFQTKPDKIDGAAKDSVNTAPTPGGSPGNGSTSPVDPSEPQPEPCTSNCDVAILTSLSVAGGVYTLNQFDSSNNIVGEGFASDELSYGVEVPHDFIGAVLPISVTGAAYTTISYSISKSAKYSYGSLKYGESIINLQLNPLEDAIVWIDVKSGDGLHNKQYKITFTYERNVQEAYRIDTNRGEYRLFGRTARKDDVLEIRIPAESSTSGQEKVTSCKAYGTAIDCLLKASDFKKPDSNEGSLFLTLTRGGVIVPNLSGEYHFNLNPLPFVQNSPGFTYRHLTKDQLKQEDYKYGYPNGRTSMERVVTIDRQQFPASLSGAVLWTTKTSDITSLTTQPLKWTYEDVKFSVEPYSYEPSLIVDNQERTHSYSSFSKLYDYYYYVFLYDAKGNPIGYALSKQVLTEDNVGDATLLIKFGSQVEVDFGPNVGSGSGTVTHP